MVNEVVSRITSCHLCEEFKPLWWEYWNPLNYPMHFWRAAGYYEKGNFYIPATGYGTIPAACPIHLEELKREAYKKSFDPKT